MPASERELDTPSLPSRLLRQGADLARGNSKACFGAMRLVPEVSLFILYLVSFEWLRRASLLPLESYQNPVILGSLASHLGSRPKLCVYAILILAALIWRRRAAWGDWNALPHGSALRWVIMTTVVALAWPLVASPYNFLTEQLHAVDRILLLTLALGIFRKPILTIPFLVLCGPMIWEFNTYWCNYSWEFFGMPLRLLTLFASWLLFSCLLKTWRSTPFWFLMVCLILAHYWIPGLTKLRMGWFTGNDVAYLLPNSYAGGWLTNMAADTIATITSRLSSINLLLICGAATVELGCLFVMLTRWRGVIVYFLILASFHLGIFLMSGICLWQWAMVELVAAIIFWRGGLLKNTPIFQPWNLLLSFLIIVTSPLWLRSAALSWFDGPIKYVYRFDAIDAEGNRKNLSPQFFAPYDRQMSLHALDHLAQGRPLIYNDGKASAAERCQARTLADLERLEQSIGVVPYPFREIREERVETTSEFLTTFIGHYNRDPDRNRWLRYISPPPGIATSAPPNSLLHGEKIHRVQGYQVLSYFDGKRYREMRETKVLDVVIPDSP